VWTNTITFRVKDRTETGKEKVPGIKKNGGRPLRLGVWERSMEEGSVGCR
jgi:hypothetical protein